MQCPGESEHDLGGTGGIGFEFDGGRISEEDPNFSLVIYDSFAADS